MCTYAAKHSRSGNHTYPILSINVATSSSEPEAPRADCHPRVSKASKANGLSDRFSIGVVSAYRGECVLSNRKERRHKSTFPSLALRFRRGTGGKRATWGKHAPQSLSPLPRGPRCTTPPGHQGATAGHRVNAPANSPPPHASQLHPPYGLLSKKKTRIPRGKPEMLPKRSLWGS